MNKNLEKKIIFFGNLIFFWNVDLIFSDFCFLKFDLFFFLVLCIGNVYVQCIGPGQPTRVYVEIYVVSISSINAESMVSNVQIITDSNGLLFQLFLSITSSFVRQQDFVVDFLLTQHWKDPRLRFSENASKILELHQLRQIKKLWLPDPYIINAKSGTTSD